MKLFKKTHLILGVLAALVAFPVAGNAASNCSVAVMNRLLPYKVSSGTDNNVNQAIGDLVSGYYSALSQATGSAAGSSSDPRVQGLLAAASAGQAGFAAIASKLPALIGAIDEARGDADDLYMSLSTVRGKEGSFFPEPGKYTDAYNEGLVAPLQGVKGRVVPYIFGIDPNQDRVAVNLFDHDVTSRDDILGQAIFFRNQAGQGPKTAIAMTAAHGGVIYLIDYEVVPIACQPAWDIMLKPFYQGAALNKVESATIITSLTYSALKSATELKAKGIFF